MNKIVSFVIIGIIGLCLFGCTGVNEKVYNDNPDVTEYDTNELVGDMNSSNDDSENVNNITPLQEENIRNNLIPFIIYSDYKALKAKWNIDKREFIISDDFYFEYETPEKNFTILPSLWDGGNNFVMCSKSLTNLNDIDVHYLEDFGLNRPLTVGPNVIASPLANKSGYNIKISEHGEITNIKFYLDTITDDGQQILDDSVTLSFVKYLENNLTIILSDFDNFKMFVVEYNIKNDLWKYHIINTNEFEDKHARSFPVFPDMCIETNNRYYFNYGGDIACINLNDYSFNMQKNITRKYRKLLKDLNITGRNEGSIAPISSAGDLMLVHVPISYGAYIEFILVAFREEELLGALHIKNNKCIIYDGQGNANSVNINLNYDSIIFPRASNIVW